MLSMKPETVIVCTRKRICVCGQTCGEAWKFTCREVCGRWVCACVRVRVRVCLVGGRGRGTICIGARARCGGVRDETRPG